MTQVMPPPQVGEGSTNLTTPSVSSPQWGVVHLEQTGTGSSAVFTERVVIYTLATFTNCVSFRCSRAGASLQGTWAAVRNTLFNLQPVEGFAKYNVVSTAPPSSAVNTGETGTFATFRLRITSNNGATFTDAGGLLRIHHADGKWTDHWALWDIWHDADATWSFEAERMASGGTYDFQSVQAFLAFQLGTGHWSASPLKGSWVHVPNYAITSSD